MVGIQIGKEQEERKRQEEGLNFETTPWWNFVTIMGYADEELRSASLSSLSNCGLNPRRRRRRSYDISGSGFEDATSEMQLQLGGERGGERDHMM